MITQRVKQIVEKIKSSLNFDGNIGQQLLRILKVFHLADRSSFPHATIHTDSERHCFRHYWSISTQPTRDSNTPLLRHKRNQHRT